MSDSGSWVASSLGHVLERAQREQAAAEEHMASCQRRPCDRCERYSCRRCGAPCSGRRYCEDCDATVAREAMLRPTRDSIPPHFRWAYQADESVLLSRVRAAAELITRGLSSPPSTGLLFVGPTGAGKTSLAVAMLDAWVRCDPRRRVGSLFVEASSLARARARHRLGADEPPLVQSAMTCPLLLLDDLGAEREDRDGCIADVIWTRTNHDRPIWITSGLSETKSGVIEAIKTRYDGGFARRVAECTRQVVLGGSP